MLAWIHVATASALRVETTPPFSQRAQCVNQMMVDNWFERVSIFVQCASLPNYPLSNIIIYITIYDPVN